MRSGEAFDWKRINFVLEVPQLYYNNIIAYYIFGAWCPWPSNGHYSFCGWYVLIVFQTTFEGGYTIPNPASNFYSFCFWGEGQKCGGVHERKPGPSPQRLAEVSGGSLQRLGGAAENWPNAVRIWKDLATWSYLEGFASPQFQLFGLPARYSHSLSLCLSLSLPLSSEYMIYKMYESRSHIRNMIFRAYTTNI